MLLAVLLATHLAMAVANAQPVELSNIVPSGDNPVVAIFKDVLGVGWKDSSQGCIKCSLTDMSQSRWSSQSSMYSEISPGASVVLEYEGVFAPSSVLELWMKGPGVKRVSIYISDTVRNRRSREAILSRPDLASNRGEVPFTYLDIENGWVKIQVQLDKLVDLAIGDPGYNQVVFKDATGDGFWMLLDEVLLLHPSAVGKGAAMPILQEIGTRRPDIYLPEDDQDPPLRPQAPSDPHRYIMRMRSGTTGADLLTICSELAGLSSEDRRFRGECDESSVQATATDDTIMGWRFVTITVDSMADLETMRDNLGDKVEYFERDAEVSLIPPIVEEPEEEEEEEEEEGILRPEELSGRLILAAPPSGATSRTTASPYSPGLSYWGLDRVDEMGATVDERIDTGDLDGTGVHIFVVDTGVRTSHIAFDGRIGKGYATTGDSVEDENGHGTHCAGTIAGASQGVAPGAIVHPVKVLDAKGRGSLSDVILGLQWIQQYKRSEGISNAVVSMSLGSGRFQSLNDAVDDLALTDKITVVVAAGNDAVDACNRSPASANLVITVGSTGLTDQRSSFSNLGPCLSLFAPGERILSAAITGDTNETRLSGTSMATPHVAGAAALVLQYRPGTGPLQIKAALLGAAVPVTLGTIPPSPSLRLNVLPARLTGAAGPSLLPCQECPPPPLCSDLEPCLCARPLPCPDPPPCPEPSCPPAPGPGPPAPEPKAPADSTTMQIPTPEVSIAWTLFDNTCPALLADPDMVARMRQALTSFFPNHNSELIVRCGNTTMTLNQEAVTGSQA